MKNRASIQAKLELLGLVENMESLEFQKKIWQEAEFEVLAEVQKAGVIITTPDKESFGERVKPMEEFSKDPEINELIQAIQVVK